MKVISLDFDGVVHAYTRPWTASDVILDGPVPGAFDFILEARRAGYEIVIQSIRALDSDGRTAIRDWLVANGMDREVADDIDISAEKTRAAVYIDDRGFRFEGTFPRPQDLVAMKPWNRK